MRRIVCVGNRFVPTDDFGPRVCEALAGTALPPGVELVEGGLGGLDLLGVLEGTERVVVVDAVHGVDTPGGLVLLEGAEVAATACGRYDHAAGLPYLLRMLRHACPPPWPEVLLLGCEGAADEAAVEAAARLSVRLAEVGREAWEPAPP